MLSGMTITLRPPHEQRDTRALLIQQQRVTQGDLPLPLLLRSPYIALLWALVLSTVVAALALGHTRVPRTERGVVVASPSAADGLTPLLMLPSSARAYVKPGQVAAIDTGGSDPLKLVITSVDTGGPKVVAHLSRCHEGHCLSLAAGSNYAATAALGLRSLASYALPRS